MSSNNMKVMLTTEGTYPFHPGGVSTWCDTLVKKMESVDFVVYSVLMDPFVTQKYELPPSASLIKMPLWGTEEPSEHLGTPFSTEYLAKKRTTSDVIHDEFLPLFRQLIEDIINPVKRPEKLADVLLQLHLYFQHYEYKVTFKSQETWEAYKQVILEHVAEGESKLSKPDIYGLIQSLGWVYRFLTILNTPIPDVHVCHSSAAAFCGIPCLLAKLKNNTPFLLTEHGIYLREQYLSLANREYSSFLTTFLIRLVHSITAINYKYADQVSPVCEYNTRWEYEFGVSPSRTRVIYNGVDKNIFKGSSFQQQKVPTVVTVSRIDPLKDIEMLIRTAAIVKKTIPDVKFVIYGSVSVPDYYEKCLELRKQLKLEDTVTFAGYTDNIAQAYQRGDLVALTSISEAFPYSVVEAMMSEKPVISTDVGGVKEALGDTGVLVPPRDDRKMAEEIINLLKNPELRARLAEEAKERALNHFTLEKVLENHLKTYIRLAVKPKSSQAEVKTSVKSVAHIDQKRLSRQNLWVQKAFSFKEFSMFKEAIMALRNAINEYPQSNIVPVLLLEIAEIYHQLGELDQSLQEVEKYKLLLNMKD
ncbi:MAG: GT4 family glycosyltransferase PelF [Bacillaceae bacterium]|nr:GT4 family glycosyltransferase PelF [Bacillaceae bacterium]